MIASYIVQFYVNNTLLTTSEELCQHEAYTVAAPKDAFVQSPENRWHLMERCIALEAIKKLFVGETLRVAWQESIDMLDTEYILIRRYS
jgi:hypothetical protein